MSGEGPEGGAPKSGYGAKWKKYLLLYVIIGGIVYLLIYFVFLRGGGSIY